MSRCLPFQSWDLSRKDASQVESIKKLHSESGNAKHSNGKIREIKENKKENSREKERNKKRSRQQGKIDYSVQKKLGHDRGSELLESFRDWKKDSVDQWERSGVTEEEGLPSSVPNNPCNSLESTQSSSRKNKLLVAQVKRKDQGLILRIKVPLIKPKERVFVNTSTDLKNNQPMTTTASAITEPLCSPNEAVAVPPISAGEAYSCLKEKTSAKPQELPSTPPTDEHPCFSGRVAPAAAATDFISSSCGVGGGYWQLGMGKCFSDLVLNWNPSSLQLDDLNHGSQDWLSAPPPPRRQSPQGNENAVSCKAGKHNHSRSGLISANSLQPQSCYLPELDIYQLPYVIPF